MIKKKPLTILERVEQLANSYLGKEPVERSKFISEVMELIERAKSPAMFCPKCDMRMSIDLDSGVLNCFNCGNKVTLIKSVSPPAIIEPSHTQKTKINPGSSPDGKLLEAIDNVEKKTNKPNSTGDKIRKLANSRGSSNPTKEDEDVLRSAVPQLKGKSTGINWC